MLGYAEVGYIIFINNKIILASHVEFIGKDVKYIRFDDEIPDKMNMGHSFTNRTPTTTWHFRIVYKFITDNIHKNTWDVFQDFAGKNFFT